MDDAPPSPTRRGQSRVAKLMQNAAFHSLVMCVGGHAMAVGIEVLYARMCVPSDWQSFALHFLYSGSQVCSGLRTLSNTAHQMSSLSGGMVLGFLVSQIKQCLV